MENRKGLSAIIITLIMIAIALAVVGIVWYVLSNTVETTTDQINQSSSEFYQTCSQAGYNLTGTGQTCNGTTKYIGGQKCCDGVVS